MKTLFITLALLVAFPFGIISECVAPADAAEGRTAKKVREKSVRGVVKVVDPAAKVIVVHGGSDFCFTAEPALLRDINVNDRVIVRYVEQGGKKFARSIKHDQKTKVH
jgi:hypothetical protein